MTKLENTTFLMIHFTITITIYLGMWKLFNLQNVHLSNSIVFVMLLIGFLNWYKAFKLELSTNKSIKTSSLYRIISSIATIWFFVLATIFSTLYAPVIIAEWLTHRLWI